MLARVLVLACVAIAPAADAPLTFEVASVKPVSPSGPFSVGMRGGPGSSDPSRFTASNMTLIGLITRAYNVPSYRVAGPQWLYDDRFEIVANVPPTATNDQFLAMLRNLLADRFQLVTHKESRQAPVYALTVAKSGPRMKESAPASDSGQNEFQFKFDGSRYHVEAEHMTMAELANVISRQLQRTVVDLTGLSAHYALAIDFAPLSMSVPTGDDPPHPTDAGPTIFTALQQQLGLKLESRTAPVEMIVVDRATRTPIEN